MTILLSLIDMTFSSTRRLRKRVTVIREQPVLCASSACVKRVEMVFGSHLLSMVSEQAASRMSASAILPAASLKETPVNCSSRIRFFRVTLLSRWR